MIKHLKLFIIPYSIVFTWISFAFLDLKGSDGNIGLLQEGTSVLYEKFDNVPIHCGPNPKLQDCIDGALKSELDKTILFGNSQLHAVNNIEEDSELVALRLHKKSLKHNEYAFTVSYGNANFQEMLWAFKELLSQLDIKKIYIACVFDDMREVGLRFEMLNKESESQDFDIRNSKQTFFPELSLQNISEEAIQKIFTDTPAWNTRHELKYRINVNLRSFRNKVFRITPETKRKILPYAYEINIGHLESILRTASDNNVQVITYIAPLLQDLQIPYIQEEYLDYKKDIERVSIINNAKFFNFEEVVPNKDWGLKQSTQFSSSLEKDYMHFTEEGHIILANKLAESIQP